MLILKLANYFGVTAFVVKAVLIGGLAVAALGAFAAYRSGLINKGVQQERQQQKERDDEAVNNARQGRDRVRDCRNSGGVWDSTTGLCHGR